MENTRALAKVKPNWDFWGLINNEGRYVLDPVYHTIYDWNDGLARVEKEKTQRDVGGPWTNHHNGQYAFVTPDGNTVTEYFGYAEDFSNGMAAVNRDQKWGFIDRTGQMAVPIQFDDKYTFTPQGRCIVCLNGKWGVIDRQGRWILENRFEGLSCFTHDLFLATKKGFTGKTHQFLIDTRGNKILDLPHKWKWYQPVSENLLLYGTSSGYPGERFYGFMDMRGNIKTPARFYTDSDSSFHTDTFHEGKLYVQTKDGEYGYIDEEARYHPQGSTRNRFRDFEPEHEPVPPAHPLFDEVLEYNGNLALARKGDLWGIIDDKDRTVVDFVYQRRIVRSVGDKGLFFSKYSPKFSCGLLGICEERDTIYSGYIDTQGRTAIDLKFRIAEPFEAVKVDV